MHTSVAVFLAFVVIYFGAVVMPFEVATQMVGWAAQAVAMTGAVATFFLMHNNKLKMLPSAAVLVCATAAFATASMVTVECIRRDDCQNDVSKHALYLSSGPMLGSAAFMGYLLAVAAGLPLWSAIVAAILFVPLLFVYIVPAVAVFSTKLLKTRTE